MKLSPEERVVIMRCGHGRYAIHKDGAALPLQGSGFPLKVANQMAAAIRREIRAADLDASIRPCITCSVPFRSEGKHNRMCARCRARAQDAAGSPHSIVGRSR